MRQPLAGIVTLFTLFTNFVNHSYELFSAFAFFCGAWQSASTGSLAG
jgi:hypothetical protein